MKAVQVNQHGGPEVIKINEIDKPGAQDDQVLVENQAAALNPFDLFILSGAMELKFPFTLGGDFAGTNPETGEELWGQAYALGSGTGSLAEFVAVKKDKSGLKPKNINFEEAAALVLVGVSAIKALDQLAVGQGTKLLIQGGAGGIGSAAIQYAKHRGAYVAATVRGGDVDFATSLGANEVIDFEKQKIEEILKDYDAVFDTVRGGGVAEATFKVLKKGGRLISMAQQPDEELASRYGVAASGIQTSPDKLTLDKLKDLVEQGAIKPEVAKTFTLDETAEAFKYLDTGHPRGKVIVRIK